MVRGTQGLPEEDRITAIEDSARKLLEMWEDPIKVAEHLLDLLRRSADVLTT